MAIKASAQITISKVIDVYAVYRYYKLQSSTLAKPSKPTANPPSGWSDTEPAYVSGSTNTLYFVDCNVYSDKSFSFSEVSKSSSYEAAKDAWNKANNAQNSIDNLEIGGRNLVLNSTNLSKWTMETGISVSKEDEWFKVLDSSHSYARWGIYTDIAVEPNTTYTLSVYCKNGNKVPYVGGGPMSKSSMYFGENWEVSNAKNGIRFIITITTGSSDNAWRFYLCVNPNATGQYVYFKLPKLEKGNKPTDWSPAPEDAIATVDVEYYLSTSVTSLSGGSWSTTAPTWVNGKYMWSRTVTVDGAGNKTYSPSQNGVCIAGAKGDTGNTGAAGKGVKSIVEQYYKSTSATALSGGSWSATYPGWENGKYIWTKSVITYTDNTTTTTTAVCVTGAKGDKGNTGATGNGISKIEEHYAVSSSNSTAPTSWSSTVPTMTTTNKYLWNYETITYTSGSTVDTTKRVIGVYGNTGSKGDTGANGKSIGSVINYYLATSASSNVTTGTSGWSTTVQSVSASKKYLWNYEVVKYSDGTTASTTTPCIIGAYGDTGAKGDKGETGATGAMGETLSNGKLIRKDVMFAEGVNGVVVYNNSGNGTVTVTRQAKSSDNPCGDYELLIQNTGTAFPGIGGFAWSHQSRANAVFIYRIIAKIPTGRNIVWTANLFGDGGTKKWLTSQAGTGKFTEYICKVTCGATGVFSSIGFLYVNGPVGSSSSPVKWYVAYAGVWDMTDYEDFDKEIKNTESSLRETISEKSADIINECEGIIFKALETYTSTSDFDEFKRTTENQLKILSDSTTLQFKQTTEELNKVNADLQSKFNTITKYFTFDINGLTIGQVDNPYKVIIDNDRYSMTVNDVEVMWIANGKVYTSEIEVTKVLRLIDYMIDKDSAGNVNCAYIGGDS